MVRKLSIVGNLHYILSLLGFDGQEIIYRGESELYPIFVGESSYKEKGIALCWTAKKQIDIN